MDSKSQYTFPEGKLGPDFAKDKLKDFNQLINAGLSFVVISLPGVGVSCFLKYFTMKNPSFVIHIDLYDLPTLSQHEFYKLLLTQLGGKPGSKSDETLLLETRKLLGELSKKRGNIVIIFSRFDQLSGQFDWNFLSNIQGLSNVPEGKVVLIFTSTKPLSEIAPDALSGGNLNFYSKELYFKPFSKEDLKKLLKVDSSRPTPKLVLEKLLELSGGHNQLFHILLSSQKEDLLLDQFVKMQLKEFVDYLDYHQRKQVQRIALGKKIEEADDYLLGIGMVKKSGSSYQLFTSLLTEYIKRYLPVKLPVKEGRLFKLLRKNIGSTVTKDEIFDSVWGEHNEDATDWALDALIYRLRKHPFMKANGYVIESHKKVGYTLVQT